MSLASYNSRWHRIHSQRSAAVVRNTLQRCGLYYAYVLYILLVAQHLTLVSVGVALLSDRLKLRGCMMLCTMPIAIIGYAVIANIGDGHPKVKYGSKKSPVTIC